jgi:hypothetical protein
MMILLKRECDTNQKYARCDVVLGVIVNRNDVGHSTVKLASRREKGMCWMSKNERYTCHYELTEGAYNDVAYRNRKTGQKIITI